MLQIKPRTKLKIFQVFSKANMFLGVLNLGCVGLLLLCEQPVPLDAILSAALNIVMWYVSDSAIEFTKKTYGLDDKGNFSFKAQGGDQNERK